MFFSSEEDDGSGFSVGVPTGGPSTLSSLFGREEPGNESLKYTAPKQPKAKGEDTQTADKKTEPPAVLKACACHTYRLVDGKYQSLGKLGAAVLGSHAACDYKILLYMSQKKPVTTAVIHQNFKLNVQKNNYAAFYDDEQRNWSLCFDDESSLIEFAKWVALAKYNVSKSFITQDLNDTSPGQEINKGDSVEMQYTGWLFENNAIGKVFDSSKLSGKLFKFKVGKGKVIKGMDEGVIGMRRNSKRLLVIPPNMAYGSKSVGNKVPPNSTLVFEIEVTRAKFANPEEDKSHVSESQPSQIVVNGTDGAAKEETTEPVAIPDDDQPELRRSSSIKDRTKSINEQLSKTPENSKSKLLERMSRMGQSVMSPQNLHKASSETELSEAVDIEGRPSLSREGSMKAESPKPVLKPKPEGITKPVPMYSEPAVSQQQVPQTPPNFQRPHQPYLSSYNSSLTAPHQVAMYQQPQPMFTPYQQQQNPATLYGQPLASQSPDVNLLVADGKVRHTEIKSDLTRMIEKLDNISNQVNMIQSQQNQLSHSQRFMLTSGQNPAVEMDAVVIMQNVSRIIKENEKLRTECEEKSKKIENLNDRMTDLLTKNQMFFEKSNELLANQSSSMQNNASKSIEKVQHLEQEKVKLESDMAALQKENIILKTKEEESLKSETNYTLKIQQLTKQLKETKQKAEMAGTSSSEHESLIEELQKKLKEEKKEQKKLKLSSEQIEEELSEIKMEKESIAKNVADLKKKRKQDKTKFDEEFEELKAQHEEELHKLHQRYKKSNSGDNEKLEQLQEELQSKHKKQIEQLQKKQTDEIENLRNKYEHELENVRNEKNDTEKNYNDKLKLDEEKDGHISKLKSENERLHNNLKELQDNLSQLKHDQTDGEESLMLKSENEKLKESLLKLEDDVKEKSLLLEKQSSNTDVQDKISELENELVGKLEIIEKMKVKLNDAQENMEALEKAKDSAYDEGVEEGRAMVKKVSNASYEKGLEEGKKSAAESKNQPTDVQLSKQTIAAEVKKVMNSVFFELKNKFKPDEQYEGKNVVLELLNTIKAITLRLMRDEDNEESTSEEESDDEEASEEESDNDDTKNHEDTEDNVTKLTEKKLPEAVSEANENTSDSRTNIDSVESTKEEGEDKHASVLNQSDSVSSSTDQNESNDSTNKERKNTLESVGLDSSMFATTEHKEKITTDEREIESNPPPLETKKVSPSPPESELFFSSPDQSKETIKEEPKKSSNGLFDDDNDDSDDGMFSASKSKSSTKKSTTASAFDRSPPPLFGDDDDDTNWI